MKSSHKPFRSKTRTGLRANAAGPTYPLPLGAHDRRGKFDHSIAKCSAVCTGQCSSASYVLRRSYIFRPLYAWIRPIRVSVPSGFSSGSCTIKTVRNTSATRHKCCMLAIMPHVSGYTILRYGPAQHNMGSFRRPPQCSVDNRLIIVAITLPDMPLLLARPRRTYRACWDLSPEVCLLAVSCHCLLVILCNIMRGA